jgi:hypothetical protein
VSTPLEALDVIGSEDVDLTPDLRHIEIYTRQGLLTVLWHGRPAHGAAVVACGGAIGGLLGPAHGLYQRLGTELASTGVAMLRLGYRRPGQLDACCLDLAAAVQLVSGAGATRVVTMGHSFFHGDRDEILPVEASATVKAIAGVGELIVIPNDSHPLAKAGPIIEERLSEWLPQVLATA